MKFVSRARRAFRPVGHVDRMTQTRVVGWAAGPARLSVEAWIDGKCVATTTPDAIRNDVAAAYPARPGARTSGFSLDLPPAYLRPDDLSELRIVARPTTPVLPTATLGIFQLAGAALQESLAHAPAADLLSPFPKPVTELIAARWPEDCADLASAHRQRRFVERLKQLLATPGVNALPALADYARYLTVTFAHCRFVEKHFPVTNPRASAGAADFHCKPNSVRELFAIIHQLYVLRSSGVQGDFAEFGCFKGYSSAMLSFACQQLGITMHIFDSFEGLPPAPGSGYEAGQYAGGLDEVRENVTRFGSIDNVRFHKGFFADTLREWSPPPLMCLWMDVDLEISARDLMVVADRVDPRGTLFSHECSPEIFRDGEIVSAPSPDNPITPMVDRFKSLGRPLTGEYVSGFTGAFWAREGGTPVVENAILFDLVNSL